MAGLRERRHAQTRADIVDAAFQLFAARGFAEVTMEEVARTAGVSRSTAYRRFPTKEDVVLEIPNRWLEVYDGAVAGLEPGVGFVEAIEIAATAVASHIDADIDRVRTAYAILEEAPSLNVAGVANAEWLRRIAELAERRGGHDAETAKVIAGAYMGGLDAMMFHWASTGGAGSVVEATRRAHDRMRPILR
ncbi:MAG: TetR family transcriptional regulator [Actinomycetota bacterium]